MISSPLGRVIISGCSAGLVAVSNLSSGLVVQMIADHQGAPITDLQVAPKPIQVHSSSTSCCRNNFDSIFSFRVLVRSNVFCGWLPVAIVE